MSFDVLTAIVVIVPMALGASPIVAVVGFAVINCLYHVVYLSAIFMVSDFSMKRLRRFLFEGMATLLVSCLLFALARLVPVPALIAAFACALAASAAAAMLSLKGIRNIMALTAPEEKEK